MISLKNKIMFGIYFMYLLRKLKSPFVRESVALGVLSAVLLYFVSVSSVIANMFDSTNFYRYLVIAFSHTSSVVQLTIILFGVAGFLLVRNITLHTVLKRSLV